MAAAVLATRTLLRGSPKSIVAAHDTLLVPHSILLEGRMGAKKFKYFPDRDLEPPAEFRNVVMPERHRLPLLPKTPSVWTSGTAAASLAYHIYIYMCVCVCRHYLKQPSRNRKKQNPRFS